MFFSKEKRKAAWVQTALERYERPLLQYALSIVQDLDRARDIVQDTFMRLYNQEQEAIEGHLSQWLFTVCRNCALKSLKKEDRYIYVEAQEFEQKRCEGLTPFDELERKERTARLMELVKELPRNQQEVVRLRFQHHHSYQEISDITGLSVGNVGFLLNAAMRNLRTKMERDEKDEKIIYLTKTAAGIMRGNLTDQDLTDYALNELDPGQRLYIESMLAVSTECRNDVYQTLELAQMLEEGFEESAEVTPLARLTPAQRAHLTRPRRRRAAFALFYKTSAALAVAACVTFALANPHLWNGKDGANNVVTVGTTVTQMVTNVTSPIVEDVNISPLDYIVTFEEESSEWLKAASDALPQPEVICTPPSWLESSDLSNLH